MIRQGSMALFFASILGCAVPVMATPIIWTLTGVTFTDGGKASGTFLWDTDTVDSHDALNVPTSWSITVSGGDTSTFPTFTYNPSNSVLDWLDLGDPARDFLIEGTSTNNPFGRNRELRFTPVINLSDSGGFVALDLNTHAGGSGGVECFSCAPFRLINAGSLTAVPEPGTLLLLGSGVAVVRLWTKIEWKRRSRRKCQFPVGIF